MLARSGALPTGSGRSFELKWNGFRAIVSTEDRARVRSRREYDFTATVPKPRWLPDGLVLDGELVAWRERALAAEARAKAVLERAEEAAARERARKSGARES